MFDMQIRNYFCKESYKNIQTEKWKNTDAKVLKLCLKNVFILLAAFYSASKIN